MTILSKIAKRFLSGRAVELDYIIDHPIEVQQEQFEFLASALGVTSYGADHGFSVGANYDNFASRLPIVTYDDFYPQIEKVMRGEWQTLYNQQPNWYAKSSGTTSAVSKYIPTTDLILEKCHKQGMKDVLTYYYKLYPDGGAIDGKVLTLGGTLKPNPFGGKGFAGDLSGLLIQNQPFFAASKRIPNKEIALLEDFEQKIEYIVENCSYQNVTSFAGVPVWYMVLANKILEYTGKDNMCEVWQNIEFFAHGGTSFDPYREQFKKLFPSDRMKYMETYNASEGFFAIADDPTRSDMLLMLDYGIYYEFLETKYLSSPKYAVPLEGVKTGVNYAIIISTCGGLWRYMIGDTVTFTSTKPYRIKITGRTKHFINMAGEEVIIDNAEKAFAAASSATGAIVTEYTAAPLFKKAGESGLHQWVIEFGQEPSDLEKFIEVFDETLKSVNSDYAVKRFKNMALDMPQFIVAPKGTFYKWMASRGKLGGQNKIPRLANNREHIESLLLLIEKR